jgi:hypothetical protein
MKKNGSGGGSALPFILLALLVLGGGGAAYYYFVVAKPKEDWKERGVIEVPYLLWGGDVAAFDANGGTNTQEDSLYGKAGLKLRFTDGNDFGKQVDDYLANKTPFLRGTLSQLALYSDKLGKDPAARPVVFLQLTWSAGDHLVARGNVKTLADLKGKKIALQKNGPHVGMLDDVLWTARLGWNDVKVEWTDDVSGDKGPAAAFRDNPNIDACFALTPDMVGLTGGLDKTGDGGKTVSGAHVLVSTADMKRSIADVYACRKDFYDANKKMVKLFTAGYLKGAEEVVLAKKEQKKDGKSDKYQELLKLTREVFGKDVPTDDDAAGLLEDAVFVGLPGNKSFFTDKGNLSGFDAKQATVLDLAVNQGYAREKNEFLKADLDYAELKTLGNLTLQDPPEERFHPNLKLLPQNTIYSFTITFGNNQSDFPEENYGADFQRALRMASLFGNAVMSVRGHADPSNLVPQFLYSAKKRGVVREQGGDYVLADGTKVDLNDTKALLGLIEKYDLTDVDPDPKHGGVNPKELAGLLQDLSNKRANAVRDSVMKYAGKRSLRVDKSQVQAVGVGAAEAIFGNPKTNEEMAANRRVEFRLVRVGGPEDVNAADFDY